MTGRSGSGPVRRIIPEFSERMVADESDCKRKAADRYYRCYAYAESADLREWAGHRFLLSMDADDPADTELYQFSCHKVGQTYVGYLSVFHLGPQSIDIQLATSRDGLTFSRVRRGEPFIPSGPLRYYDYMAMACSSPSRSSSATRSTSITPRPITRTARTRHAATPRPSRSARRWPRSSATGLPPWKPA